MRAAALRRYAAEPLEPRVLLANVIWDGGPTGNGTNFLDPTNWVGGALPVPTDTATLDSTGTNPLITIPGTVTVAAINTSRNLQLNGGTISGGTVTATGGAQLLVGAITSVLDGVALATNLSMTNTSIHVFNGLTLSGGAVVTLNQTASFGAYLDFYGSGNQTLGGSGQVVFDGTGTNPSCFVRPVSTGGSLTIGAGITVRTGTQGGFVGYNPYGLTVQGTILAQTAGKTLTLDASSVTNNGTLQATAGTLSIAGNNTNSGLVSVSAAGNLIWSGTLNLAGGVVRLSNGARLSLTSDVTVQSNPSGSVIESVPTTPGQQPGVVDLGGVNRTFTVNDGTASSDLIINAPIINGSLTKAGAGTMRLDVPSTYAGTTTINAGTLQSGVANAIRTLSPVVMSGSGTLDLNGFDQTVPSIAGTGAVTLGSATLTIGGNDTASFAATIGGEGSIVRMNSGSQTLTGTLAHTGGGVRALDGQLILSGTNTFEGPISASSSGPRFGTIEVHSDTSLGALSNAVTLSGGTLRVVGTFNSGRSLTLGTPGGNGHGRIEVTPGNTLTLASPVIGLAGLTKIGAGTLTLQGANSYRGRTLVSGGTLRLGPTAILHPFSVITIEANGMLDAGEGDKALGSLFGTGSLIIGDGTLSMGELGAVSEFSGPVSGAGRFVKVGIGTTTLSGIVSVGGGVSVDEGTLILTNAANNFTGGVALGGTGVVSVAADEQLGASSNGISFDGGTLVASSSSFSSARNISIGTGGATLDIAEGQTLDSSGALSGAGMLKKTGAGMLVRTAAAGAFNGPVEVMGGTLRLAGPEGALGSSSSITIATGTLELDSASAGNHAAQDRLGDSAMVVLRSGGTLRVLGTAGMLTSETLGTVKVRGSARTELFAGMAVGSATHLLLGALQRDGAGSLLRVKPTSENTLGATERLHVADLQMPLSRIRIVREAAGAADLASAYHPKFGIVRSGFVAPRRVSFGDSSEGELSGVVGMIS